MNPINVFIETGKKKTFAGALDWPGWCRGAADEAAALRALLDYAPRYAQMLHGSAVEFLLPRATADFVIVERRAGDASTDFGAPAADLDADRRELDRGELDRFQGILSACWQALDGAVQRARGKELRKGPRGGGRDLAKIVAHVLEADRAYLARLAWKPRPAAGSDPWDEIGQVRQDVRDALEAALRGELPERGRRGGSLWPPRYFVRRLAWHTLDHAWEIDDRVI